MWLIAKPTLSECQFEIVVGDDIDFDPYVGTVKRGVGRSPWTGTTISGDYIKAEAQAGRMGSQMYAVAVKIGRKLNFRCPDNADLSAVRAAQDELDRLEPKWLLRDVVADERYPLVASDMRPHHYGMSEWRKFFSSRQLLVMGTAVEELRHLQDETKEQLDVGRATAIGAYLALAFDKMATYNNISASWNVLAFRC